MTPLAKKAATEMAAHVDVWTAHAQSMAAAVAALEQSSKALAAAAAAVASTAHALNAPRRIVRDGAGRAVGTETVN